MTCQTVALILNEDGTVHDKAYTWGAAQNYALCEGRKVLAVADDGYMTKDDIQALCEAERERFLDCFGVG